MRNNSWQGSRLGLTLRLAKTDEMASADVFSAEQWETLRTFRPGMSGSALMQHALLHYAKILPDLIIEEKEQELEKLKQAKCRLFTTE